MPVAQLIAANMTVIIPMLATEPVSQLVYDSQTESITARLRSQYFNPSALSWMEVLKLTI